MLPEMRGQSSDRWFSFHGQVSPLSEGFDKDGGVRARRKL